MKFVIENYTYQTRVRKLGSVQENDRSDSAYSLEYKVAYRVRIGGRILSSGFSTLASAERAIRLYLRTAKQIKAKKRKHISDLKVGLKKINQKAAQYINYWERTELKRLKLINQQSSPGDSEDIGHPSDFLDELRELLQSRALERAICD